MNDQGTIESPEPSRARESDSRNCFEFPVAREDAGRRLDEFLASRFGSLSRMRIANLIAAGACTVDGSARSAGHRLIESETIIISFDEGAPGAMIPEAVRLDIIFEDEHLIVVVKPTGMLVHPTRSVKGGTLANALAYHFNREFYERSELGVSGFDLELECYRCFEPETPNPELRTRNPKPALPAHGKAHTLIRPGIVHRLDRATSGLMVIAKTNAALTRLSNHFRRRIVEKRYQAIVRGDIAEESGTIIAPIGRDPGRRPRWLVMGGGKPAETRFRVLERFDDATLLELEPVTGRTNQLRIHCAYRGNPIAGDELYGQTDGEHASLKTEDAARLCLHASKLAFHHPVSGEWKKFESALPTDFTSHIQKLRTDAQRSIDTA